MSLMNVCHVFEWWSFLTNVCHVFEWWLFDECLSRVWMMIVWWMSVTCLNDDYLMNVCHMFEWWSFLTNVCHVFEWWFFDECLSRVWMVITVEATVASRVWRSGRTATEGATATWRRWWRHVGSPWRYDSTSSVLLWLRRRHSATGLYQ